MDPIVTAEIGVITGLASLITAIVALVKAIRGDGRKTDPPITPADSTTTDD